MKMSVIFGVGQMSLGIFLKGSNAIYRRNCLDFVFEFLPQILLLLGLFGWMDYLIIVKWLTNWGSLTQYAPSIISTMIDMALNGGNPSTPTDLPIVGTAAEQKMIENILIYIILICVPTMLCVKPCILSCRASSHKEVPAGEEFIAAERVVNDKDEFNLHDNIVKSAGVKDSHGHGFGDLMIHSLIETIEFVLGTISNTASYLRLWALSLAHGQLAKVFFDMCLVDALKSGSFIMLFLSFFAFIFATIGVLMMMDLLECCLHTLRLHWVEF